MPIVLFTGQSWLFVPPLDQPLELRLENGRFGALRPNPLPGPPPCATTQIARVVETSSSTRLGVGTDRRAAASMHPAFAR